MVGLSDAVDAGQLADELLEGRPEGGSMTDILGNLGSLGNLGADAMLTVLSTLIDAIGEGTEFTGEQIDKLGELEGKLAEKVASLKG
jgi:hypothetical protein